VIPAIVLLALALVSALAFIVRGALDRSFARRTAFDRVWSGERVTVDEHVAPLDFTAWIARLGRGWVS
jgi:hypothetical protein